MAINFCYDDLGPNPDLGHPNLTPPGISTHTLDSAWPFSVPLRLLVYLQRAGLSFRSWLVDQAPMGSWYPVALSWHDHSIDYFNLMPDKVVDLVRCKKIKILFYYHEGDNPAVIKSLLDDHVRTHRLPDDCYLFVSANTAADALENFVYFSDHEYFFQYVNRRQRVPLVNTILRPYEFTILNRTHKWWRASIMSDLWRHNLLDHSLWSYNTACDISDRESDNPLRVQESSDWNRALEDFVRHGPYVCDSSDDRAHNDHTRVNIDLYTKSYCHVIVETHFDADGSKGTFLTEKTFKCLKFGQPFVLVGPPGSLACLRDQGYRVFDHCLDNSYDTVLDNTTRWWEIKRVIADLQKQNMHDWFMTCQDDVRHNQQLFRSRFKPDLVRLAQHLNAI